MVYGPSRPILLVTLLTGALVLLSACAAGAEGARSGTDTTTRPRLRQGGPRLPPHSGYDPSRRGWVRSGVVWLRPEDAAAPVGGCLARPIRLRTDHVALVSTASWTESLQAAEIAEAHVVTLLQTYGDALDLRLPHEPLPVTVHANRQAFQDALRTSGPDHPGWGAFYEARRGTVHVCLEPAPRAPLPLRADVRHEMTHQILDLSVPLAGRSRVYQGHYLWLWEGFAAAVETLGDTPGLDTGRLRRERFALRRQRGEETPLRELFRLDQAALEGRHYDHCAVFVAWLLADGVPGSRQAVLDTLADVLRDRARAGDVERRLGLDTEALDARWRTAR